MGRGKRREPLSTLSPSHSAHPRTLSFSFSLASLQHKETSAEERGLSLKCKIKVVNKVYAL